MCGVFGVISDSPIDAALLEAAQAIQAHRGPDAQSVQRFTLGRWHVGLAHQRLAIIDLTAAGAPADAFAVRALVDCLQR